MTGPGPRGRGSREEDAEDAEDAELRQQVLVLYLANSALTARVVSWALYDGSAEDAPDTGDDPDPPFATGLDALRAGWRLIGAAPLLPAAPGTEYTTSHFKFEFWFERMVRRGGPAGAGGAGEDRR